MHGASGFGIYGVDIFVRNDDVEKALQLIKENAALKKCKMKNGNTH